MLRPPFPLSNSSGISVRWSFGNKSTYSNGNVSQWSVTKSSIKTSGFKTKRAAKQKLPENPFTYIEQETAWRPGGYGRPGSRKSDWNGYCYNLIGVTVISVLKTGNTVNSDADLRAKSRVLDHLKYSSINLAQAFAERRQSADLIVKNVNRLASVALAIRKGKLNHAHELLFNDRSIHERGRLKNLLIQGRKVKGKNGVIYDVPAAASNLSNYWLEYAYGWRPLLSDIKGAAEEIAKSYAVNRPMTVTGVGKASWEPPKYAHARVNTQSYEWMTSEFEAKTRYKISFRVDDLAASKLSSTGITDPLLLAWELLPYSFVMDWFVPVGAYLSQLSATRGLTFDSGCVTRQQKEFHNSQWISVNDGVSNYVYEGLGKSVRKFTFSRVPLASFPSPTLLEPDPLNWQKYTSGVALLTQLFTKSNKQRVI